LPDTSCDPERIAKWTEFHERVDELPEEERAVVNLCFYFNLTQAEAARRLGVHPRQVSRLWASAIRKLPDPEL
jgi:RNA polymerase sigma-70 factor (ECF subfamily)